MPRYLVILIALTLLAGCVNQQNEIDTYRQVLAEEVPPAIDYCPTDTLSLPQAMALANQDNETLALRGEDYLQALIAKDVAYAAFLPTITLDPVYFQREKFSTGLLAGLLSPPIPSHTFDLPLNAQINVFNGFRDVAAVAQAAANIETRRAVLLDLQQNLLLEVAQTYYQILRSEQQVQVLQNSVAVQEGRVRDMRARQKVGLARILDVAQTEAQASGTRVTLIQARNDVRNGRAVLAFLIGQKCVDGRLVDQFNIPERLPCLRDLQTVAAENRRDIQAAQSQVQSAQQALLVAIRQYVPSANLSFSYFITRQSLPTQVDWNGFVNVRVPLYTGGRIEAGIRSAWSVLRQAKLNESLTRRRVDQDVQVALQNLTTATDRLHEIGVELKAAEEAYRQASESFKVGLATNLEQLIAQDRLLLAQLQYASETLTRKVLYLNLQKSTGRLTVPCPTSQPTSQPTTAPSQHNSS